MRTPSLVTAALVTAVAQESMPVVGVRALPVTPGPEECTVESPTASELFARVGIVSLAATPEAQTEIDIEEGPDAGSNFSSQPAIRSTRRRSMP